MKEDDIIYLQNKYHEMYGISENYTNISSFLKNEENMINILFHETINYTRTLIASLNKGFIKNVYIALDGIPSMAKLKEQKNRRYVGFHMNNIKNEIVKKYKFKEDDIFQLDLYRYRLLICAGSVFMEKLQQALFHLDIGLDIEIDTTLTKGEGEKKLIYAMDKYFDTYNSFCVMSPDSDMMILLGLMANKLTIQNAQLFSFRIDQQNNQYQFFNLNLLMDSFKKYFTEKTNGIITNKILFNIFFMFLCLEMIFYQD